MRIVNVAVTLALLVPSTHGEWEMKGEFQGSQHNDYLGSDVAVLNENLIAGGARQWFNGPPNPKGYVSAFLKTSDQWSKTSTIIGPHNMGMFGREMDTDHHGFLFISTPNSNAGIASHAYDGETGLLSATSSDRFFSGEYNMGQSVAVNEDGNRLVVTKYYSSSSSSQVDLHIFFKDATNGHWDAGSAIKGPGNELLGNDVAIHGSTIVAQSYSKVFTITPDGSGGWVAKFLRDKVFPHRDRGVPIAAGKEIIVVGEPDAGAFYVHRHSGTAWGEQQKVTASGYDHFGHQIAVRTDPNDMIFVSAVKQQGSLNVVRVYAYDEDSAQFEFSEELSLDDDSGHDGFGASISVYHRTLAIGASTRSIRVSPTSNATVGAVFVYEESMCNTWELEGPDPGKLGDTSSMNITCASGKGDFSIKWGDGTPDEVHAGQARLELTHIYSQTGVYTVTTINGGITKTLKYIVVYDPTEGFITGGGHFMSPPGAFEWDLSAAGEAKFGFVAKFTKKNPTIPIGNTDFEFSDGKLDFKSSSYEWLMVNQANKNAQFKGKGHIGDDTTERKFMVWATDGTSKEPSECDEFRIEITEDNETAIYDNGMQQCLDGGSIVIHSPNHLRQPKVPKRI